MKIALDVDGVLADVMESWLVHNNKVRRAISKQDITDWDFWKKFRIDRFSFSEELSACWRSWDSIPPTERDLSGTTESLSALARVDIVTAREKSTDSYVKNWLEMHGVAYDGYVSVIDGPMKAELDYDVFIDDSPLNASSFLRNGKTVLLYSQPWNRGMSAPGLRRISNLSEAVRVLGS